MTRILRAGSLVLLLTSPSLPLVISGTHPGAAGEGTASLTVLNDRRERGESTDPFYWAGFVAAGDWR